MTKKFGSIPNMGKDVSLLQEYWLVLEPTQPSRDTWVSFARHKEVGA
jgi:hypothetical protein